MPTLMTANEVYKFTIEDVSSLVAAQLKVPVKFIKLEFITDYSDNVTHVNATVDKKGVDAQHAQYKSPGRGITE